MAFGIGTSIRKAARRADGGFTREWNRWGQDAVRDAGYGAVAGQFKALLEYGGKSSGHYNKEEAESLGKGLGVNYQQVEQTRSLRQAQESLTRQGRLLEIQQAADSRKQRLQGQVTVRRRARAEQRSTKGGTLLTSPVGTPGLTTGGGAGSALLGL